MRGIHLAGNRVYLSAVVSWNRVGGFYMFLTYSVIAFELSVQLIFAPDHMSCGVFVVPASHNLPPDKRDALSLDLGSSPLP